MTKPLVRDLVIDSRTVMVVSFGGLHDEPSNAARPHIQLATTVRETFRHLPLRHVGWISPRIEHQLTMHLENPRDCDLAGRGLCGTRTLGGTLCILNRSQ